MSDGLACANRRPRLVLRCVEFVLELMLYCTEVVKFTHVDIVADERVR